MNGCNRCSASAAARPSGKFGRHAPVSTREMAVSPRGRSSDSRRGGKAAEVRKAAEVMPSRLEGIHVP